MSALGMSYDVKSHVNCAMTKLQHRYIMCVQVGIAKTVTSGSKNDHRADWPQAGP